MLRTNAASNSASRRLRRALRGTALLTIIALTVTIAGIRPESQAGEERAAAKSPEATEPASTVKLSGVVVDSQGSPVPNAIVVSRRDQMVRENSVTHTLSDGTFTLEVVPSSRRPALSWAWAYAEGHGVRAINLHRFSRTTPVVMEDLVLKLPPAEKSEFVVLDPSGKPVAGARANPWDMAWPNGVYSADEPTGLTGPIPEEIAQMLQRTTDEAGRVSFDAVPQAVLESVRVQTPEFGVQDFRDPKAELRLKPVGKIEGRIVSQHLDQLKDLKIYLAADDGMGKKGEAIVIVDEAGRFDVPALASGKLRMGMAWPEELPTRLELPESRPTLEAGKTLQLDIVERPIVTVRGRIVAGKNHTPVEGAEVSLRNVRSPEMPQHIETNKEGWFEGRTIAGEHYVQVVSLGNDQQIAETYDYPRLSNKTIPEGVEEFQLEEIVLVPRDVVSGKLLRPDGSPSVRASVGLRRGNSFRHLAGFATTDEQGEFHMPVSDRKLMQENYPDIPSEWLLISQPESPQETPTRTLLKVVSEEPLVLQEP